MNFIFASAFTAVLGRDSIQVHLPDEPGTLETALTELFRQNPDEMALFELENLAINGSLRAIYVRDETVLDETSLLKDNDLVRVFTPISGG